MRAGFIGVDVFFVISGYLIIPRIISELSTDSFSFTDFYERRIRRLAPALLATTALTTLAALVILTPLELTNLAKEAIAAQLYASNIYYWRYLNYFNLQANNSYLLHTWSLGVEEQFYLTFPLMLWIMAKWRQTRLLTIIFAITVASFILNVATIGWKPEATFYLLPTRAWEFGAGAIAPQLTVFAARRRIPNGILALAGGLLLVLALVAYEPTIDFPGWFALIPVVGTVLLLAAGTDQKTLASRLIGGAVPRYVGKISYEVYLVHWPIKVFLPLLTIEVTQVDRVFGVALTLFLAALIYHLVEAPVRTRRVLGEKKYLVAAYTCATGCFVALLVVAVGTGGFPARLSAGASKLASAADDTEKRFRNCESKAANPCVIGSAEGHATWLIYGDSHADALAAAFAEHLASRGRSSYFAFRSACMPVRDVGDDGCRSFNREVETFVAAHPSVDTLVLVSTWSLVDGFVDDRHKFVKGKDAAASFVRSLERTLAVYENKRVIVWLPVPGARSSVPGTLARDAMLGRHTDLTVSRNEYLSRTQFLRSALKRHPRVIVIDPAERLCGTGTCQITSGGRPLYYDNAHPATSQTPIFEGIINKALGDDLFK